MSWSVTHVLPTCRAVGGCVEKEARSRYRVTKEGVDWLFQRAAHVRLFSDHVTDAVLRSMHDDAAHDMHWIHILYALTNEKHT